jgi:CheY-like chemotaxis protein
MKHLAKPAPIRVLIIDDDPLIRTLLVSELRKRCLVAVASEGSEGYQKALELTPDVAVIDVNMPGWDGLRTLEAFRTNARLQDVKIIMLTADSSKQTVMAAIRGGADDYLIKTIYSKAEFFKKLNRLFPGALDNALTPEAASGGACEQAEAFGISPGAMNGSARRHLNPAAQRGAAAVAAVPCPLFVTEASPPAAVDQHALQEMIDGWE